MITTDDLIKEIVKTQALMFEAIKAILSILEKDGIISILEKDTA